jgi:hypothetical protein
MRLQGGWLAGSVGGTVSTLGLLYTTLAAREGPLIVPNAPVLSAAVLPLVEPTDVDLRARVPATVTPAEAERLLGERIATPMRGPPRVTLEELIGDEVVVRIAATPQERADGPLLASEVLNASSEIPRTSEDVGSWTH